MGEVSANEREVPALDLGDLGAQRLLGIEGSLRRAVGVLSQASGNGHGRLHERVMRAAAADR
ncbi:hypothetical protein D3C77_434340 [compost metagenome]